MHLWGTRSELTFIKNLGTNTEHGFTQDRETWLRKYLQAAELREDWGTMFKEKILKTVREEIEQCQE